MADTEKIFSHKDLIVWQKSMDLTVLIFEYTRYFPSEERYGLSSQMRNAAVSIPSNIAEGRRRGTRKDYLSFLRIAYGSAAELETQLIIANRVSILKEANFKTAMSLLTEIQKMLAAMIKNLNPRRLT